MALRGLSLNVPHFYLFNENRIIDLKGIEENFFWNIHDF